MHVVHAATVLRVRAVKLIASRHIRLWRRCLGNARARTAKHDENTGKHCCRTEEHWARSKRFDGRVDGHGLYPRLNEMQTWGVGEVPGRSAYLYYEREDLRTPLENYVMLRMIYQLSSRLLGEDLWCTFARYDLSRERRA